MSAFGRPKSQSGGWRSGWWSTHAVKFKTHDLQHNPLRGAFVTQLSTHQKFESSLQRINFLDIDILFVKTGEELSCS
jgi:hypothetical protein